MTARARRSVIGLEEDAMQFHATSRPHRHLRLEHTGAVWTAGMILLCLTIAGVSAPEAATPPSGTLSIAQPSVTWTGSITGVGTGENTCVDGVSCDSFEVILAP